jgi:nucleoside-diphosphate-sugar epimerase
LTTPVFVVGATGRSGQALVRALVERGIPLVPVARSLERWQASGLPGKARLADLTDSFALRQALAGAERVVSCAHARHTAAILAAAPTWARFLLLGSTRRYTRWPDLLGLGVLQGETALLASGRPGVMLHPTMIYGAQGENNVQPLAALLRRLPVVPLPGGGRALVQPIYQDDVTRSIIAALDVAWTEPQALVIAGPAPVPYVTFVRAVALAAGLRRPRIVPLPAGLLMAASPLTAWLPGLPTIRREQIRRLLEDKAFDISRMVATLGVRPVELAEGLALTFRH